jgi:hypothetical protein
MGLFACIVACLAYILNFQIISVIGGSRTSCVFLNTELLVHAGPCRSMQVHACFSVFLAPNGFVSVTFASATYASSCLAYS